MHQSEERIKRYLFVSDFGYLLLHDPEFRRVRKEHLAEVGKRIRLKENIRLLSDLLRDLEGHRFSRESHFGTRFQYHPETAEIQSVLQLPAGYGTLSTNFGLTCQSETKVRFMWVTAARMFT
jgi:hypothetical protein